MHGLEHPDHGVQFPHDASTERESISSYSKDNKYNVIHTKGHVKLESSVCVDLYKPVILVFFKLKSHNFDKTTSRIQIKIKCDC